MFPPIVETFRPEGVFKVTKPHFVSAIISHKVKVMKGIDLWFTCVRGSVKAVVAVFKNNL